MEVAVHCNFGVTPSTYFTVNKIMDSIQESMTRAETGPSVVHGWTQGQTQSLPGIPRLVVLTFARTVSVPTGCSRIGAVPDLSLDSGCRLLEMTV